MREDVIQQAVLFLKNPQVQSAAMAKKVAFLESKGLTNEEIEEALARSKGSTTSTSTSTSPTPTPLNNALAPPPPPSLPGGYPYPAYHSPPPPPPPGFFGSVGWKDMLIGLFLVGGAVYAGSGLVKKYLAPALNWPSATDLEADKKDLEDKFKTTSTSLTTVREQTASLLATLEDQNQQVKESTQSMDASLKELIKTGKDREAEIKTLKEELEKIKESIPKLVEKNKEDQKYTFAELQSEINSLKSLLLNRKPELPASKPFSIEKSIPSWQLSNITSPSSSLASTPSASIPINASNPSSSSSNPQSSPPNSSNLINGNSNVNLSNPSQSSEIQPSWITEPEKKAPSEVEEKPEQDA